MSCNEYEYDGFLPKIDDMGFFDGRDKVEKHLLKNGIDPKILKKLGPIGKVYDVYSLVQSAEKNIGEGNWKQFFIDATANAISGAAAAGAVAAVGFVVGTGPLERVMNFEPIESKA